MIEQDFFSWNTIIFSYQGHEFMGTSHNDKTYDYNEDNKLPKGVNSEIKKKNVWKTSR